jgi:hypothetical protein
MGPTIAAITIKVFDVGRIFAELQRSLDPADSPSRISEYPRPVPIYTTPQQRKLHSG